MPFKTRILNAIITEAVQARIPPTDFDALLKFMPGANLQLLTHSLKELSKPIQRGNCSNLLAKVHRIYHRKLAEQATMYPVFHVFESAYRAKLAIWMEGYYGARDWWQSVFVGLQERIRTGSASALTELNGKRISNSTVRAMENMLKNVAGENLDRHTLTEWSGYQVLSNAKLSDIEELIFEQWSAMKSEFPSVLHNGKPLEPAVFKAKFKRVRDARNTVYHHRELSQRVDIVETVEELLDLIDVHLGTTLENVHASTRLPPLNITFEPRHRLIHQANSIFEVETSRQDGRTRLHDVAADTCGDALAKQIANMAGDERSKLSCLRIMPPVGAAAS